MNTSLYFNGHLRFLYCIQLVIRVDADNAQLSFPLSFFLYCSALGTQSY